MLLFKLSALLFKYQALLFKPSVWRIVIASVARQSLQKTKWHPLTGMPFFMRNISLPLMLINNNGFF